MLPRQRKALFICLLTATVLGLPQLWLMKPGGGQSQIQFHPGFLVADQLNVFNFGRYWLFNLGVGIFLLPLGFIKSPRLVKKLFLAFLPLFLIGNLFQFSREMAANHKFFNLFLVAYNMMVAHA